MDTGTFLSVFASVLWTLSVPGTSFTLLGQNGIGVNFRHSYQRLFKDNQAYSVMKAIEKRKLMKM